jgi:hypothetical protein
MNLIELKDFTFEKARFIGMGRGVLPATNISDTTYVLTLWLSGASDPISIPYTTSEERDMEVDFIKASLLTI